MKGFLLGAVCGVAITLTVVHGRSDDQDDAKRREIPRAPAKRTVAAVEPETVQEIEPESSIRDVARSPLPGASTTAGPKAAPATVSPLFADLFKDDSSGIAISPVVQVHKKMEAELEDDVWSPYMEANLRDYFQRQPDMQRIEVLALDCRTTICEIQAAGFDSDANSADPQSHPAAVFQRVVSAIDHEPWGPELTNYGTLVTSNSDRALFVVQMVRNN